MNFKHTFAALGILSALSSAFGATEPVSYAVARHLVLGPATHWDYTAIDPTHRRLFVTRGDHVDVLQLPAGSPVGSIAHTDGVHGVAFAPALGLGFTSNGKSNSITVFDLATLQPRTEIALTGNKPDAILVEPRSGKLYVFEGASASVEVIDTATLKVVASIKASGGPEFAVADGRGRVFFNDEDHGSIDVIDSATDKLVAVWPMTGCEGPTGLAIDSRHDRLFSACHNGRLVVVSAADGHSVGSYPIGEHPDAVVFDPKTGSVLTPCGGGTGTLNVAREITPEHFVVQQNLATAPGARTMAMDEVDGKVYLPTVVGGVFEVVVAAPTR